MSAANAVGQIVTGASVERAVKRTLLDASATDSPSWIDFYLGEIERVEGYAPGTIQRPLDVLTTSEFEKWPEDQLPVYLIVCPGLSGAPIRRGDSSWEAPFGVGVAVVASDVDGAATRTLAQAHTAAIRTAIMQHKSLRNADGTPGFAVDTIWRDERYDDLSFDDSRSLGSGRAVFDVVVSQVVREAGPIITGTGPVTVDPGPWPAVTSITTTVEPETAAEAVTA